MSKYKKFSDGFADSECGDFIDNDDWEEIRDEVITWFEEHSDQFVQNTLEVYKLTDNDVGYSALLKDWKQWRELHQPYEPKFAPEFVRACIEDKIYLTLSHLYQHSGHGKISWRGGTTGLLVTFTMNILLGDKHDDFRVSYDYNLSINIGCGNHDEIPRS